MASALFWKLDLTGMGEEFHRPARSILVGIQKSTKSVKIFKFILKMKFQIGICWIDVLQIFITDS